MIDYGVVHFIYKFQKILQFLSFSNFQLKKVFVFYKERLCDLLRATSFLRSRTVVFKKIALFSRALLLILCLSIKKRVKIWILANSGIIQLVIIFFQQFLYLNCLSFSLFQNSKPESSIIILIHSFHLWMVPFYFFLHIYFNSIPSFQILSKRIFA